MGRPSPPIFVSARYRSRQDREMIGDGPDCEVSVPFCAALLFPGPKNEGIGPSPYSALLIGTL